MPNWKKVIVSGSDAALNSLNVTSALTASGLIYPTADGDNGDFLTTDGIGNLSFGRPNVYANVKNVSGVELQKGTPVHATGTAGNASEVIAASASVASTMPATYVLNETLADDAEGLAIIVGYINGVNTSPFGEGDVVFVGENGGFTNVKPQGSGNLIQNLGLVSKVDATNGSGYVYGSGRSNDVPNLPVGKIWVGSSTYSVTSSIVTLDEDNSQAQITGSLAITSVVNAGTDTDKFLVLDATNNVDFRTGDQVRSDIGAGTGDGTVTGTGTDNQVATWNGTTSLDGSSNFTYDGTTLDLTYTGTGDLLRLTSTDGGASSAPDLTFCRNSASPADNDTLGNIQFWGKSSAPADKLYSAIYGRIACATSGQTKGNLSFKQECNNSFIDTANFSPNGLYVMPPNDFAITAPGIGLTVTGGISGSGKLYIGETDTNTSSTSALVLNGTEVEKRTLGANAFNSTAFTTCNGTVTSVTAGAGMTQTGTSTVNPTLNVIGGTAITVNADNIEVTSACNTAWNAKTTCTGTVTGTGVDNQIAVFTNTNNISGSNNLTYDGTTLDTNGNLDVAGTVRLGYTGNDPVIFGNPAGKRTEWNNPGYFEIYAEDTDSPGTFRETVDIDGDFNGGGFVGVYPSNTDNRPGVQMWSRPDNGENHLTIYPFTPTGGTQYPQIFAAYISSSTAHPSSINYTGSFIHLSGSYDNKIVVGTCVTDANVGSNNLYVIGDVAGTTKLTIGSSQTNTGTLSSIAGGTLNTASADCSFIGGGEKNYVNRCYGGIVAGCNNCVDALAAHAVIGGGFLNCTQANSSFIGAGCSNSISTNYYSAIVGGCNNTISGNYIGCFFIGGGSNNSVGGYSNNSIVGGSSNTISGGYQTSFHFIGGGRLNTISAYYFDCAFTIVGGMCNIICGTAGCKASSILGGTSNCIRSSNSVIGGGQYNTGSGDYGFIGSGYLNNICGGESYAVIGGGRQNRVDGDYSFIGGGYLNQNIHQCSVVAGGYANCVCSCQSSIGGGFSNLINAAGDGRSTIGGGYNSGISGTCGYHTIAGGSTNCISTANDMNTIGGGQNNDILCNIANSTIAGGASNLICRTSGTDFGSTIAGGALNCILESNDGAIGGGYSNLITGANYATIAGGTLNTASADCSFIGGGQLNAITSGSSTIGGGCDNCITGIYDFIGGGISNCICNAKCSSIVGGDQNVISGSNSSRYHFIGGGLVNKICIPDNGVNTTAVSAIVGGYNNCLTIGGSTIAGGTSNTISGYEGFIGGGNANTVSGCYSSIVAGRFNCVSGCCSAVVNGCKNCVTANFTSIAGGTLNTASGACSFIGGGCGNTAAGTFSYAGGEGSCTTGAQSFAHGYQVVASGGASAAFGSVNNASGLNSFIAGGVSNDVCSCNGLASGLGNEVCSNAKSSVVSGEQNVVETPFSLVVGVCNNVLGGDIISLHGGNIVGGSNNCVNGANSSGNLVMGNSNNIGNASTSVGGAAAFGGGNDVFAGGTVAIGINNSTISGQPTYGKNSLIVGCQNQNQFGNASIVGGFASDGYGTNSIAFGLGATSATGNQQYAFGEGTTNPNNGSIANIDNSMVIGRFNVFSITDCHLFAVGNGSSVSSRSNAFNVSSNGRVGIGCTAPQTPLDVNGTARVTTLVETSAKRYKQNIVSLQDQLDNIKKLKPVEFEWKETQKKDIGLIAEDVEKVSPQLVEYDDNGDLMGVKYSKITSLLIKAVQEQQEQIEELKEEIFILKQNK